MNGPMIIEPAIIITLLTFGIVLFLLGLIGKVKAQIIEVGTDNKSVRFISGFIGLAFIILALYFIGLPWLEKKTPSVGVLPEVTNTPTVETPVFTETPTRIPKPSPTETEVISPAGGETKIDIDGMEVVYIPAGRAFVGASEKDEQMIGDYELESESPGHIVQLDAFWMDRTEVTNRMYTRFVNETGYRTVSERNNLGVILTDGEFKEVKGVTWRDPAGDGSGIRGIMDHPVVQMNWLDAISYCEWVGGSLPTEAQWERAARGDTKSLYPWGDGPFDDNYLNFSDANLGIAADLNRYNDGYKFTAPVGSYPAGASPFGILDLAGNAAEWVFDYYDAHYYKYSEKVNPTGPSIGKFHLLKGGSWYSGAVNNRVANRIDNSSPNAIHQVYGFRCVRFCDEGFCSRR
jgi:eukaryotic-like serine/threonine-protein kinase